MLGEQIQTIIDETAQKAIDIWNKNNPISASVQRYADTHPRPVHVTRVQAAGMLQLSAPTVSRLIKNGEIKLNKAGMIPITEIDKFSLAAE